jgi:hypothetical protein
MMPLELSITPLIVTLQIVASLVTLLVKLTPLESSNTVVIIFIVLATVVSYYCNIHRALFIGQSVSTIV